MRNSKNSSITTLPVSPTADRQRRLRRYVFTMSVRVVCFVGAVLLHDVWSVVPLILAGVIPWVAVVVANAGNRRGGDLVRPGGVVDIRRDDPTAATRPQAPVDMSGATWKSPTGESWAANDTTSGGSRAEWDRPSTAGPAPATPMPTPRGAAHVPPEEGPDQ